MCVSRTYMTSQHETNLWSTHVNIVRLAAPIRRCVRWRTQVFKIRVCKRFLPSPPSPSSLIFWRSFHFLRGQNPPKPVFLCSETKPKRLNCYAGYQREAGHSYLFFNTQGRKGVYEEARWKHVSKKLGSRLFALAIWPTESRRDHDEYEVNAQVWQLSIQLNMDQSYTVYDLHNTVILVCKSVIFYTDGYQIFRIHSLPVLLTLCKIQVRKISNLYFT